jgi:hypothetical protein
MIHNLSTVIFDTLCSCLGLAADSAEASAMIIPAYQDPEPAPQPPRSRDLVYYDLSPEPPREGAWETLEYTGRCPLVSAFPAYRLLVVCYGPHCEENAMTIRYFLNLDGAGFPRSILRKAGVWPEPSPPLPTILHEETGSLWRKRADLAITLRILDQSRYPSPQNAIRTPPPVIFHSL